MLKFSMHFLPRSYDALQEEIDMVDTVKVREEFASFLDLESVDILKNGYDQLIPDFTGEYFNNTEIDLYLEISGLKNYPELNNENNNSLKYKEYLKRLELVLVNAKGFTLDIGCDDPTDIVQLLPSNCRYIGLDPNLKEYKSGAINGMAEFLPFKDNVFDTVMFNTSLDHIFDYNLAISEGTRVLKEKGILIISTLVWLEKLELWRDRIHFHHFTPANVEGMLENFQVIQSDSYRYGKDTHRYGAFICAQKI
jgi:SAM-dependent methyltransferase